MVEAKPQYAKLNTQPVKTMIDVSFWLTFTKLKLDSWKLETPQVPIKGRISLPNTANLASSLLLSSTSFPSASTVKSVGGLISCEVAGILAHTNTIEEFEAYDL